MSELLPIFNLFSNRPSQGNFHAEMFNQSIGLFNQVCAQAWINAIVDTVMRRDNRLMDIESVPSGTIKARRHGGTRAVRIDRIRGTMGRVHDFDLAFRPLDERSRDRWVNIASARLQGIPLDAVDLIQVGEVFFVEDGHHRISVARAFGETCIDAHVTVWETCCPLPKATAHPAPFAAALSTE